MNTLTFVCENAGVPKLKKMPLSRLSRLKNPRIVFVDGGVKLQAEISYRSGDWTLASDGGAVDVFPHLSVGLLLTISQAMRAH
jgi:hypothetical protein